MVYRYRPILDTDPFGTILRKETSPVQLKKEMPQTVMTLEGVLLHPSDNITDAFLIKKLRAAGFGINVFTVNSNKRQQELFSMGATAVFTDFPELP